MSRRNWSEQEVRSLVDDYFDMLSKELLGSDYNKTEHRAHLLKLLEDRTAASVERKHQNVSAILRELRVPFVDGYKPLSNYQDLLAQVVREKLSHSQDLYRLADKISASLPSVQDALSWAEPAREVPPPLPTEAGWEDRNPGMKPLPPGHDYAGRDANNAELGRLGERFVVELERRRLREAGQTRLADQVEWTSDARGDGFGYDVTSYDVLGKPIFIEVKTTNLGLRFPFVATRNEVEVSRKLDRDYRLFRLFRFAKNARFFVLRGALNKTCLLQPRTYLARF